MRTPSWLAVAGLLLAALPAAATALVTVVQRDRNFSVPQVSITPGTVVRFTNEDDYPHQISVQGPGIAYDSDLIEAERFTELAFPGAGLFEVRCGVHPRMRMSVKVR
ncbi:cupredoxin domain-containing protein [Roseomonas sp. WA12]